MAATGYQQKLEGMTEEEASRLANLYETNYSAWLAETGIKEGTPADIRAAHTAAKATFEQQRAVLAQKKGSPGRSQAAPNSVASALNGLSLLRQTTQSTSILGQ